MIAPLPGVGPVAGSAVIDVVDERLGLTPDDTEHAFERFWRADASRSRDDGGSRFGLAIVKSLVGRHGGRVEVISSPGAGATFRVHLQLAPDPGQPIGGSLVTRA